MPCKISLNQSEFTQFYYIFIIQQEEFFFYSKDTHSLASSTVQDTPYETHDHMGLSYTSSFYSAG